MNLFDGLQLLELVKDGDVKTYLASDPKNARNLLLHWMAVGSGSEIRSLLELLDSLPPAGRSLILEAGIREGRMYLITENPTRFPGLKEWLTMAAQDKAAEVVDTRGRPGQWQMPSAATGVEAEKVAATRPELAPAAPAAHVPESEPGEFTKLFTSPVAPPALAQTPPKGAADEGEFTRLFKQSPPAQAPAPAISLAQPPANTQEPGEFTRILMTPGEPASRAPGAPSKASEPGEFTRIFLTPQSPPKAETPQHTPVVPKAHPPEKVESGEFTRFFQSPLATPTPATASDDYFSKAAAQAPAQPDAGEFTKIFGKPGGLIEPPQSKEATGVFNAPRAPASAPGPSEYTRMFSAPAQPAISAPAPLPAPAPQPPAAAKPKSVLPLILIFAFLAVLALVLVFVFIRK